MSVVGKRVRLVGIMGEGVSIVRARLKSKDAPVQEKLHAKPFTLELDDGTKVRVVPDANVEVFGPEKTEGDTWGTLSRHPLAIPFEGLGPGPHVSVTLAGTVLAPGDRVAVAGEVTEADPVSEGAYREQPHVVVAEVRATAIATGPGAEDRVDVKARPSRDASKRLPWRSILIGAAAIAGVCAVAKAIYTSPAILIELLMFVLAILAMLQNEETKPEFEPEATWAGFLEGVGFITVGLTLLAIAASFFSALVSSQMGPSTFMIVAGCLFAATTSALRRRSQRRSLEIARAILDAPAHSTDGAWGRMVGTVRDPTPVKVIGGMSALSRVTEGPTPNIVTDGTFLIKTGKTVVEVFPQDAVWSSSVRAKAERTEKTADGEQKITTHEQLIPVGGKAVVVARMRHGEGVLRAASTGPESLLLWATADAEEPIATLEKFVTTHTRGTIIQLVLVGIIAATTLVTLIR
jgi:hypothetical protein